MSFSGDLQQFAQSTKERQDLALRKVAIDLFSRVIMRTPVDSGRLRGNWQATLNEAATSQLETTDNSKGTTQNGSGQSETKTAMTDVVLGAGMNSVFYLSNNLPYASVIEYNGHSQQAPAGMVRISVAEFQKIVKDIVGVT